MKEMRVLFLIGLICMQFLAFGQTYKSHELKSGKLVIHLSEGDLNLAPLTNKSVRVQWEKAGKKEERDFVFINKLPTPKFKVTDQGNLLKLTTSDLMVSYNKMDNVLSYANADGKVFLTEIAGTKKLEANTVQNEDCFIAEQSFDSPNDEFLFGLGQFQDGHYNLRNISRKLIQVNSQIAIPFLYSSRGFGILWNQYGITHFNPADNAVNLVKKEMAAGENNMVEVTTTSGTQKVSQRQSLYTGSFSIPADGVYDFMLDYQNMESKHLLVIDDVAYIDQTNQWLPPAASTLINLKAGNHTVQIVGKATNVPTLAWRKTNDVTTFRSPHAKSMDYVIFSGQEADEIIADYRKLTGEVPMLPEWAFGFWQCRERYTSGDHLVSTVEEFRKRKLPVDVIVQDWQYWGKYGWGVPKFDETNYPEPEKFIKKIHDLNAHFSISVWENLDKKSEVAKPYMDKNLYIQDSPWIDIYNPETQKTHWTALNDNLFTLGVDSWWMDATEPENDALAGKPTFFGPGDFYRLTYPLFVSKAVYDGQRKTDPSKRVAILTRSAFPGQQRYGTINWSGDIGWNWDTYKRQIVAGLNYNLTGMPYWTTDIGGFFRPRNDQYNDIAYHDILTRWFQWGTFNPIFRMHGYQTETEPWKYGSIVENNMREMMNLRYRLMPYIYAEAWQTSSENSTMMRPMIMDFGQDSKAIAQAYQYMFGKSILVAPVTEAGVQNWEVYLPEKVEWFDFWSGKKYKGGQTVSLPSPQDKLPLLVKAGSIIPMGRVMQYTKEKPLDTLEIRIYPGADGSFTLYEDEGDNYNYEKGNYSTIELQWNDKKQQLAIGKLQGSFAKQIKNKVFSIVLVSEQKGIAASENFNGKLINYTGKKRIVELK